MNRPLCALYWEIAGVQLEPTPQPATDAQLVHLELSVPELTGSKPILSSRDEIQAMPYAPRPSLWRRERAL
jgi:hypothetical protein